MDRDTLNAPIRYSFINGSPASFGHYFHIDTVSGLIKQVAPVDRSRAKLFTLIVKAEQDSPSRLFATAKVSIAVLPVDKNPPVLTPSSLHGYVNENSALGTIVVGNRETKEPLKITVSDADIVSNLTLRSLARPDNHCLNDLTHLKECTMSMYHRPHCFLTSGAYRPAMTHPLLTNSKPPPMRFGSIVRAF